MFIFLVLAVILLISNYGRNLLINYANESYNGSFIYFKNEGILYQDVRNYDNVEDVYEALVITINGIENVFITPKAFSIQESSLLNEQIFLPELYADDYKEGDVLILEYDNRNIEFTVKDYFDSNNYPYIYIVNSETLLELIKNDIGEAAYFLTLENWILNESTVKNMGNDLNLENISVHLESQHKLNFNVLLIIFNLFIILIMFAFFIIGIIAVFNALNDEHKINTIYRSLGYSKINIKLLTLTKMLIIIVPLLLLFVMYWIIAI